MYNTEHDALAAADVEMDEATETGVMPDIIPELGELGDSAIITEKGLARLFRRHVVTVKRAVQDGILPPPYRLFNANCWTIGALICHIERRLEEAAKEAEQEKKRLNNLSPLPSRSRRS